MSHLPRPLLSRVIPIVPVILVLAAGPALADGAGKAPGLSAKEKAAGFQPLFDGKSTQGWREFGKDKFPDRGWVVKDGMLVHEKNSKDYRAGDIITTEQFDNFERGATAA
jgi:hypothetical protein